MRNARTHTRRSLARTHAHARVQLTERARARFAFLARENVRDRRNEISITETTTGAISMRDERSTGNQARRRIAFVAPINADN